MPRTLPLALVVGLLALAIGLGHYGRERTGTTARAFPAPAFARGPAINLKQNTDWSTDAAWIDAAASFRRWGNPDRPWIDAPALKLTAEGYPLADAGTLSYMNGYPDGDYRLSFAGAGAVRVGGMGTRVGEFETSGDRRSATVRIDHSRHDLLTISVRELEQANPIRDLRLVRPGYDDGETRRFDDGFLRRLEPFAAVRVMEWGGVNRSNAHAWSDRVAPTAFLRTGPGGVSYEDMIALANESGKDLWISVPDGVNDDHARRLAHLLHAGLDPKIRVYLELGNELWNQSFPQARRMVQAARRDRSLTYGDDYRRSGQKAAKRLAEVAAIAREEFGDEASRVVPVLCGQSVNPAFLAAGLDYLAARGDHIGAIAIAPYLGILPDQDQPGLTSDELFEAMQANLRGDLARAIAEHAALSAKHQIPLMAYEWGQHLTPRNPATGVKMNEQVKRDAQDDPRMGTLYLALGRMWTERGGGLLAHYCLTSRYDDTGYWGLLHDIADPGGPKWDAVMTMARESGLKGSASHPRSYRTDNRDERPRHTRLGSSRDLPEPRPARAGSIAGGGSS